MNENVFWSMIEESWQAASGTDVLRSLLGEGRLSKEDAQRLLTSLGTVLVALRDALCTLEREELLEFDRILERKLFELDRSEVQAHTEGSDDGFLYARGFVVAAGKAYYEAVNANPKIATPDLECEDMCYISWHVYGDRFGQMPRSEISRESGSNEAGWPERKARNPTR